MLTTYRIVLHSSYLQKVFSFIIVLSYFIIFIYSSTILPKKCQAPGGTPWAELNSDDYSSADYQQNRHMMPFHLPSAVPLSKATLDAALKALWEHSLFDRLLKHVCQTRQILA